MTTKLDRTRTLVIDGVGDAVRVDFDKGAKGRDHRLTVRVYREGRLMAQSQVAWEPEQQPIAPAM